MGREIQSSQWYRLRKLTQNENLATQSASFIVMNVTPVRQLHRSGQIRENRKLTRAQSRISNILRDAGKHSDRFRELTVTA
jgi:hypothetical protein